VRPPAAAAAVPDRSTDPMYADSAHCDTASPDVLDFLYPWEEETIEWSFPPAPARILVGAAGAGREAFALSERGYEVVAFEPSAGLTGFMASRSRSRPDGVRVFKAVYEDLPSLAPAEPGRARTRLDELAPFDGSLMGLGSISHVRTPENRVRALRQFGAAPKGPVVVSFLTRRMVPVSSRPSVDRLRRTLRARRGRSPADGFSLDAGFFHLFDEAEIRDLADRAGLDVIHYDDDVRRVYPHVVLIAQNT